MEAIATISVGVWTHAVAALHLCSPIDSGFEWFNGYILAAGLQYAKTDAAATAFAVAALSLL